jgi:hypothetical protein
MKKILFNQLLDRVVKAFSMKDPNAVFMRTKRQDIVDARQLLYYLCSVRGISLADILRFMEENGLPIKHPAVINGIRKVQEKVINDQDYKLIVDKIQKSVSFELETKL